MVEKRGKPEIRKPSFYSRWNFYFYVKICAQEPLLSIFLKKIWTSKKLF
jgi:hypothetical protein